MLGVKAPRRIFSHLGRLLLCKSPNMMISLNRAAPRSGSSPRNSPLSPSIKQPRAGGALPKTASSPLQSCSPAQRELCQKHLPLSLNRAAPRSGSSLRNSLLPPPQSSSPAQREPPQKQTPPSLNRAAQRSGSPPRNSLLPPSIEQPSAAGASPEAASSLHTQTTKLGFQESSAGRSWVPGGGICAPVLWAQ